MASHPDDRFAVTDPRFELTDRGQETYTPPAETEYGEAGEPKKRGPWATCLIGCLVVAILMILLFAVAAYLVWQNWRELAATGAAEGMNQMIDATELPPEERQEMKAEVRRVADAFREGKLSNEQFMRLVNEMAESPLMTLFVVSALEKQYLAQSGLSDEEKTEGRRTLQRFVRGAADGDIGDEGVDAVMQHVAARQSDGRWRLRDRVTDDELRAALAEAKRQADTANVAEQPEDFDASAEFRRIVDAIVGEEIGEAPAMEEGAAPNQPPD